MNSDTRNTTLFLPLGLSVLCLTLFSCSVDEWRVQRSLSKIGLNEVSVSSLQEKIEKKDSETAALIVKSGIANTASSKESASILLQAIKYDQSMVIHALLEKQVPFTNEAKESALRTSISSDQLGIVNTLIKNGFPQEITMDDGQTPVAWAVSKKRRAMSRLLLSNKFTPNASEEHTQPLEIAVNEKSPSWLVREIVSSGADTNFLTKGNKTPILHEVILNSPSESLIPLLKANTDLTQLDSDGKTGVFKAVSTGDLQKVTLLADHGADITRIDEQGRNYLQLSQIFGDYPEITKYFISKGIDPHHKSSTGKNALDLSLEYTRLDASKTLIKNKAATNSETFDRLYGAGNKESIELMIMAGLVDANSTLTTGDSILIDAIKLGNIEMVKTLLEQGANPNMTAVDNEPPISYATALQDYESLKLLIEHGADVNTPFQTPPASRFKDIIKTEGRIKWFISKDPGITPIMMACDQGHLPMVKLLRESGAENRGSKKYRFWPGNFAAHQSYTDVVQYMVGAEPGSRERTVLVDLSSQRATVYGKDKEVVMSFRISSGKKGHTTRTGEFVVTNKKRLHISTIYDSEMPYFQRLSYSDFGFHTGYVPGYPASHGCIRCPNNYAYKLYNYLQVGDVVNIQR